MKLFQKTTRDGRKYRLAVLSLLVLAGCFALASINPVLASLLANLTTGVLGINAIYMGGNVGNKYVLGKHGALPDQTNQEDSDGPDSNGRA